MQKLLLIPVYDLITPPPPRSPSFLFELTFVLILNRVLGGRVQCTLGTISLHFALSTNRIAQIVPRHEWINQLKLLVQHLNTFMENLVHHSKVDGISRLNLLMHLAFLMPTHHATLDNSSLRSTNKVCN